jgi:hypothetical protein
VTNPLEIPGLQKPTFPLDPVANPDHDKLFVDVDHFAEAFELFQRSFQEPSVLDVHGGMAIAVADRNFGKTALLNRCAFWLRQHFTTLERAIHVIDLRWVPVEEHWTVKERMNTVCHHLMRNLSNDGCLAREWDLSQRRDPADVLPYVPDELTEEKTIIVLLPPTSDVMTELLDYARLTPTRVLLLAETPYPSRFADIRHLFQADRIPVVLELNTLRPDDGDRFYDERRGRYPVDAKFAVPDTDLLRGLLTLKGMSIGEFQALLYEVYMDVHRKQSPATTLTFQMVSEYFIRTTTFGGTK